jgi:2-oxo-4-hydroxy-4-carboxy-5-ureidoimidazoline decarboxylase
MATLHDLNTMDRQQLHDLLLQCCGSETWVRMMLTHFPEDDLVDLLENAEEAWFDCSEDDWKQAFTHHPRIGDMETLKKKYAGTAAAGEQQGVHSASVETIDAFAKANQAYENKFGYIFIVCATGKSAQEMLDMLRERLKNDPQDEIRVAADEQNKITKLRLEKLLDN